MLRHASFAALVVVTLTLGCGSTTPSPDAPSPAPAEAPASEPSATANPEPSAPAPAPESTSTETATPAPAEAPGADPEQAALTARATGPATGGPRGNRPCAFHESVDTYQRQCEAKVNSDGSVSVTAKGTKLNPDNGFEFTLHGGDDNQWVASGTLDAFGQCKGPFVAPVTMSIDKGVKTYELRFKQHCMIVVR